MAEAKKKTAPTKYVVLRAVEVDVGELPEDMPKGPGTAQDKPRRIVGWVPILPVKAQEGKDSMPRVFEAGGPQAAIRAYTGRGEKVIEGDYKAVPVSSWKNGERARKTVQSEHLPLEEGWEE